MKDEKRIQSDFFFILHPSAFSFPLFTLPTLALSVLIASIIGLAFYLAFGRGWLRLLVYWLVAVVGFLVGQIVATLLQFSLLPIGSVNLVEATAACLIALFATRAIWKTKTPA